MLPAATDLATTSFDAETTRAMGVAFDMACRSLRLSDVSDPLTKLIASKIVDTASAGEHDAVRLHEAVMRWAAAA
jgi:hypothetical protein